GRRRTLFADKATGLPRSSASSRGLRRNGSRVEPLTICSTSPTGRPFASLHAQPVIASAAELRYVTLPALSQLRIASAMESRVTSACAAERPSPEKGLLPIETSHGIRCEA